MGFGCANEDNVLFYRNVKLQTIRTRRHPFIIGDLSPFEVLSLFKSLLVITMADFIFASTLGPCLVVVSLSLSLCKSAMFTKPGRGTPLTAAETVLDADTPLPPILFYSTHMYTSIIDCLIRSYM